MQIEEIQEFTKDRSRIVFDTGEKIILYKGELRLLKLKEGSEISVDQYRHIVDNVLTKRAKLRSLNLLKDRPYTEYQIRKKLRDGEYPEEVIETAIDYVKSFGYINDKQYALDYIMDVSKRLSKRELYMKLQQKGIDKATLDAAFNETYGSFSDAREDVFDETDVIKKTLAKRGYIGNESYEERQKLLAYFYRRGFNMDKVYKAMNTSEYD